MIKHPAIIVDGRVFQTNTWHRGMGRYTLGILKGIFEQSPKLRTIVLLADDLPVLGEREGVIRGMHSNVEFFTLPLVSGSSRAIETGNAKIVDTFVDKYKLEGSLFLLSSLFTFDYSPFRPRRTLNAAIFYDLLPLTHWDMLGQYYGYEYFRRYRYIYEMDKLFAISEHVKDELIEYLGFKPSDVVNISGADVSLVSATPENVESTIPVRQYKYILLPGGDSPHKNMFRAVHAFEQFNVRVGGNYKLIITSFYSEESKADIHSLSSSVEFAGQVSDVELEALYANSEAILFPSLDEGLGLPILEAVNHDKKVICSNIDVFKEFSKDAFYLFNPLNTVDMTEAIYRAVSDKSSEYIRRYTPIKEEFTWKNSAAKILNTSVVKQAIPRSRKQYAIIVEQDESNELMGVIGSLVRKYGRTHEVKLFIDSLKYSKRSRPLVFNDIVPTGDIVDAFNKTSKGSRAIIITSEAKYTPALIQDGDEVIYLGTTKGRVRKIFRETFGGSI